MGLFGPTRTGYLPINGDNIPAPELPTPQKRYRRSKQQARKFNVQDWGVILLLMLTFIVILVLLLGRNPHLWKTKPISLWLVDSYSNETTGIFVTTRQGSMMGKKLKTRDGRDYLAFLGR